MPINMPAQLAKLRDQLPNPLHPYLQQSSDRVAVAPAHEFDSTDESVLSKLC